MKGLHSWLKNSSKMKRWILLILVGIIFVSYGIASIIICLFIIKVSIEIFIDTTDKMVDKSCNNELINNIKEDILSNNNVLNIDLLKTRMFASKIYVDIEIAVDANLSLIEAHNIAENIHDNLENKYPNLKHCMIHVNPYKEDNNE